MNAPVADSRTATPCATPAAARGATVLLRWEVILVVLLVAIIVANTIVSPYFLDVYNLADATFNFSEKAIIALAMALLILVREIDLSVAAIVALASLAIGYRRGGGARARRRCLRSASASGCCAASSTAFLVTCVRPAVDRRHHRHHVAVSRHRRR